MGRRFANDTFGLSDDSIELVGGPAPPRFASLSALRGLVQDGAVAAGGLGLVEGGLGGEQRVVVRLGARVDERATDADGGINPAGSDDV
jgi:hypothetical protein